MVTHGYIPLPFRLYTREEIIRSHYAWQIPIRSKMLPWNHLVLANQVIISSTLYVSIKIHISVPFKLLSSLADGYVLSHSSWDFFKNLADCIQVSVMKGLSEYNQENKDRCTRD